MLPTMWRRSRWRGRRSTTRSTRRCSRRSWPQPSGRDLSGEEALAIGLVTRLTKDPLDAARALAAEIATKSPDAVRGVKRLFRVSWNRPPEQGLALEAEIQHGLIGSANQLAAVAAV